MKNDDFPSGINAVIFLLHKPAGQGSQKNVISPDDPRVPEFFALIEEDHPFKVGMDSCTVPGAVNNCKSLLFTALDTCEGGRFSCYIGADMTMVPCSFDQDKKVSSCFKRWKRKCFTNRRTGVEQWAVRTVPQ